MHNKNYIDLLSSSNEKEFNEFKIKLENFQRAYEKFLKELNLEPHELKENLENVNFDPQVLKEFQTLEKQFDENLKLQTNQSNLHKTKTTLKQQASIQPHWLFIR